MGNGVNRQAGQREPIQSLSKRCFDGSSNRSRVWLESFWVWTRLRVLHCRCLAVKTHIKDSLFVVKNLKKFFISSPAKPLKGFLISSFPRLFTCEEPLIVIHIFTCKESLKSFSQLKKWRNDEIMNQLRLFTCEETKNLKRFFAFLLRTDNGSWQQKKTQHNQY